MENISIQRVISPPEEGRRGPTLSQYLASDSSLLAQQVFLPASSPQGGVPMDQQLRPEESCPFLGCGSLLPPGEDQHSAHMVAYRMLEGPGLLKKEGPRTSFLLYRGSREVSGHCTTDT